MNDEANMGADLYHLPGYPDHESSYYEQGYSNQPPNKTTLIKPEDQSSKPKVNDGPYGRCQICSKLLTFDDTRRITPYDYINTCEEHRIYASALQPWVIKRNLGLPYEKPMCRCAICHDEITEDELNATEASDMWTVCEKHLPYRHNYNLDRTRKELGIDIIKLVIQSKFDVMQSEGRHYQTPKGYDE
jgi:hypothetical protein